MTGPGNDLAGMRRVNLARVLHEVRLEPGLSQRDVAERTGLAAGGVSSLVNELLDARVLVLDAPATPQGRGRPKQVLGLADDYADLVAVSLTRTAVVALASTLAGRELARVHRPLPRPPSLAQTPTLLNSVIDEVILGWAHPDRLPRVAVSFPGGIGAGNVIGSIELDWSGTPDDLYAGLRRPGGPAVMLGNDGAFATLAEAREGAARGRANAVVIYLGRGLGGSATVDGQVLRGATSAPGFGHTPLDPGGAACPCGLRGCAELALSLHTFATVLGTDDSAVAADVFAQALRARAEAGEPAVLDMLARAKERMGQLADVVASLLNPEVIVLTGEGAQLAPWLLPKSAGNTRVPVVAGQWGAEAGLTGALVAAQESFFDDPLGTLKSRA